jgi:type IV pilus assembly protein PilO
MAIHLDAYFDKISKLRMVHRVLILVVTVVVLLGIFFAVVHTKTKEIASVESEVNMLADRINHAKKKAEDLEKLDAELAELQDQLIVALRLLPEASEIPSLLKSITRLGNDSDLQFLLFSPEREVPKEELYVEIPVSMEVMGGYHDVAMFFDKIGKLDRIVNIANVSMIPAKPDTTMLRTKCRALTYRFKEKEKAKGVQKKKK